MATSWSSAPKPEPSGWARFFEAIGLVRQDHEPEPPDGGPCIRIIEAE